MSVLISQPRYFKDDTGKYWNFKYRVTLPNGKTQDKTVRGTRKKWTRKQDAVEHYNQLLKDNGNYAEHITFEIATDHYIQQYEKNAKYSYCL